MARRIGSSSREAERRIMDALQIRLGARMERAMSNTLAQDYAQAADKILEFDLGGAKADRAHIRDVVGDGAQALVERSLG